MKLPSTVIDDRSSRQPEFTCFLLVVLLLMLSGFCRCQEIITTLHEGESITLPESPSALCASSPEVCDPRFNQGPDTSDKAGFFSVRGPDDRPLRTNREVFHDKTWAVTQAVWLGAITYDVEITHQGIAHHKCVEGNLDLKERPTRASLYLDNLAEYAAGTGFNYIALRFIAKPVSFLFPTWSSIEHIRGGSQWLMNCW